MVDIPLSLLFKVHTLVNTDKVKRIESEYSAMELYK